MWGYPRRSSVPIVNYRKKSDWLPCDLEQTTDFYRQDIDSILLVTNSLEVLTGDPYLLQKPLNEHMKNINAQLETEGCVIPIDLPGITAKTLVYAPTGPLWRDGDDIRRYGEAAEKGMRRAVAAGVKCPMVVPVPLLMFYNCEPIIIMGALAGLYVPLEVREHAMKNNQPVNKLDKMVVYGVHDHILDRNFRTAMGLEQGRCVARDIGGSDPERMTPERVVEYVEAVFEHVVQEDEKEIPVRLHYAPIKISVESEDDSPTPEAFRAKYPLLAAVNRAASVVPRHRARIIHLEYVGDDPILDTIMLVGKGITYDTGGLDIKTGGGMAGMHRDKCGAAGVAGFFKALSVLKPRSIRAIGALCMVRNSVDAEGYVADEIITSRAGVRVRVGNTDAEGRMVMADLLTLFKERALAEEMKNPHLLTVATLTGHADLACGPYTSVMDNGPARKKRFAFTCYEEGQGWGDAFEINTIRPEDFEFHKGKSEYEDVLQCNNAPSTSTQRGHQGPAAFLMLASGLDKHEINSEKPIKYSHLDIAASSGPYPGVPSGSPVVGLAGAYFGHQITH